MSNARILVTGATGQLGRLVVQSLLGRVPADHIVVAVRDPAKAADLAAKGVEVRAANYDQPESLVSAFAGIDRVLLISSSEVGARLPQHHNVIDAAVKAGVKLLAYTGLLHGDASPLPLKADHVATEEYLRASGLPFVLLRNGWYMENYHPYIPSSLEHGALFGAAGEGRISAAPRADYADAAARVLAEGEAHAGKVYELAGDEAFTLSQWAAALSQAAGKPVVYQNLPEADFLGLLVKIGLPEPLAAMIASADVGASKDGLFDDSHTLRRLIGRPTSRLASVLAAALKG
jgi:NAD(P)H dehydrogenase (quinone)